MLTALVMFILGKYKQDLDILGKENLNSVNGLSSSMLTR